MKSRERYRRRINISILQCTLLFKFKIVYFNSTSFHDFLYTILNLFEYLLYLNILLIVLLQLTCHLFNPVLLAISCVLCRYFLIYCILKILFQTFNCILLLIIFQMNLLQYFLYNFCFLSNSLLGFRLFLVFHSIISNYIFPLRLF